MKKFLPTFAPFFLTLVFLILKLSKVIDWHWMIVLSPAILFFLFLIGVTIYIMTMNDDMPEEVLPKQYKHN